MPRSKKRGWASQAQTRPSPVAQSRVTSSSQSSSIPPSSQGHGTTISSLSLPDFMAMVRDEVRQELDTRQLPPSMLITLNPTSTTQSVIQ